MSRSRSAASNLSEVDALAEELGAIYPPPDGFAGAGGDDLIGVGLASFQTPTVAARELVRVAFRAAPRDWGQVGDAECKALDAYPNLDGSPWRSATPSPAWTSPISDRSASGSRRAASSSRWTSPAGSWAPRAVRSP